MGLPADRSISVRAVEEQVEIRRSRRARRWRLTVPWGAPVRLTVPHRMSQGAVTAVLDAHRDWIARERSRQVPRLALDELGVSERAARRAARELVTRIAEGEAAALGVSYERIVIRGQRTRWGSCSARATLSFNWRLALAPAEVLDYVVVHEVCHLCEPNHSPRFWRLVAERRPDWRSHRDWLRVHGAELLAFTPET